MRAYLLREKFQRFWQYVRPNCTARFLDQWCKVAMRSRLEPIKKVVRTLHNHRTLIRNWFAAKGTMSSGRVEGPNHKAKVVFINAYGYRYYNTAQRQSEEQRGDKQSPNSRLGCCGLGGLPPSAARIHGSAH